MSKKITGYDVGALLYCPANMHSTIVDSLAEERFARPFSLAFCLEDTVREQDVAQAEEALYQTLERLAAAAERRSFFLPPIFIRVRSPRHLERLAVKFAPFSGLLTGFILPKFFLENCSAYLTAIQNAPAGPDYRYMPIFESPSMIDLRRRYEGLAQVRKCLEPAADRILNIRVGGNDLCQAFGLRRHVSDTIYDIRPVASLLADLVAVFSPEYVVSGPVWEYYAGNGWEDGLRREVELDLLCGFVGKTVIHPNQIPVFNACMQVPAADYQDACRILNWDPGDAHLVSSSAGATRMNEYNTHSRWAERTVRLAQIYGIKEDAAL